MVKTPTQQAPKRRGRPPKNPQASVSTPPKRRGRPPKVAVEAAVTPPKRRGRPPKAVQESAPKRRGRPPKAVQESAPKRRGRPPKNPQVVAEPPKRRGRPPKVIPPKISLRAVSKSFGATQVIPPLSLDITDGEFVVFVGPSGCGKSTLLRLIAGLEDVSGGQILIDGADMSRAAPSDRGLAMVFQSYALYPHMSVRKNIAFPLKMAGIDKGEAEKKVTNAARILNLTDYLDQRPGQLSGGQRQRVAIGRAIVRNPSAFLFDEPLSNLDAALRVNMRTEITDLHKKLDTTMIYVTHDQVEAMTMADKIVVLRAGVIEQVGAPLELYTNPTNRFVAEFIGSPKMNILEGAAAKKHKAHAIGIRPEHLQIVKKGGDFHGKVVSAEHLGSDTFLRLKQADGVEIIARAIGEAGLNYGDKVSLSPIKGCVYKFAADGSRIGARIM